MFGTPLEGWGAFGRLSRRVGGEIAQRVDKGCEIMKAYEVRLRCMVRSVKEFAQGLDCFYIYHGHKK